MEELNLQPKVDIGVPNDYVSFRPHDSAFKLEIVQHNDVQQTLVHRIKLQKIELSHPNAWNICRLCELDFQLEDSNLWVDQ
jgi:hypothetical protein